MGWSGTESTVIEATIWSIVRAPDDGRIFKNVIYFKSLFPLPLISQRNACHRP
jgi:hypothetical protein